jgi:AcrR family transcriptional regulator
VGQPAKVTSAKTHLKRQARRERILDTAVAAFRSRGYGGTSMRDIAQTLEITKGNLDYDFPDKEEILFRCHERALTHILEIARGARRSHPEPAAALRDLIEQHVAIMVEEFHGTALALEIGHLTGPRLERVVALRDRYERVLREVLRQGVRSGAFRNNDVKLTAFSILGAINWIAQWYRAAGAVTSEQIGRHFADLFLRSLAPDGGAGHGPPPGPEEVPCDTSNPARANPSA